MNIQLNGGPYDGAAVEDVDANAITLHAQLTNGDVIVILPDGDLDVVEEVTASAEHIYVRLDSLPVGEPPMVNFGYEGVVTVGEGAGE